MPERFKLVVERKVHVGHKVYLANTIFVRDAEDADRSCKDLLDRAERTPVAFSSGKVTAFTPERTL